jgi:hypothetical protein
MLKKFDGRDFIVISIDPMSKLLEINLRIKKFWSVYTKCLNINSLKNIYAD